MQGWVDNAHLHPLLTAKTAGHTTVYQLLPPAGYGEIVFVFIKQNAMKAHGEVEGTARRSHLNVALYRLQVMVSVTSRPLNPRIMGQTDPQPWFAEKLFENYRPAGLYRETLL
jgi:hypothetical protein